MANPASWAARQRPAAFPVAAISRVELMYPPMSRGISISPWTRPSGSFLVSGTGACCCTVSFCPVALAASWNRTARSSGARSLMEGTTIRVLEVPEVISAPQIWAWSIAVLAADSFGYRVIFREMDFGGNALAVGQPGPDGLAGAGPVGLGAGRSAAGPPRLAGDRQNPARLVHGRVAVDQFAGGTVDVIDAATQSGHVS